MKKIFILLFSMALLAGCYGQYWEGDYMYMREGMQSPMMIPDTISIGDYKIYIDGSNLAVVKDTNTLYIYHHNNVTQIGLSGVWIDYDDVNQELVINTSAGSITWDGTYFRNDEDTLCTQAIARSYGGTGGGIVDTAGGQEAAQLPYFTDNHTLGGIPNFTYNGTFLSLTYNGSSGQGLYFHNTSTGIGQYLYNTSSGTGFFGLNSSSGQLITLSNSLNGTAFTINSNGTGDAILINDDGSEKFRIDSSARTHMGDTLYLEYISPPPGSRYTPLIWDTLNYGVTVGDTTIVIEASWVLNWLNAPGPIEWSLDQRLVNGCPEIASWVLRDGKIIKSYGVRMDDPIGRLTADKELLVIHNATQQRQINSLRIVVILLSIFTVLILIMISVFTLRFFRS